MTEMNTMKKIEAFQGFSDDQLAAVQPFCESLSFRQGAKLFTQGDPAEHLWVVVEGAVDLRFEMPGRSSASKEHTVSSVSIGKREQVAQTFGWSCFVPPYSMRLSAYCVSDHVRIVRVAKNDLIGAFEADPRMGYVFLSYLIKVVGYRFHQFQDEVAKSKGDFMMTGW